jgi:hypothetical protein
VAVAVVGTNLDDEKPVAFGVREDQARIAFLERRFDVGDDEIVKRKVARFEA